MAVIDRLRRWATKAPAPVFVAAGHGADPVLAALRAEPGIELAATPRHATVLVVAGHLPGDLAGPLRLVHDQVPPPRATVVVGALPAAMEPAELDRLEPSELDRLPGLLRERHAAVVGGAGERTMLGPPDSPVPWQGVGPHGQGGEGMMGGTPYGRPMAMPPTEGRDGLALDRLSLRLGPFLTGLPPGLVLDVGLQGDVLEDVALSLHPPPAALDAAGVRATGPSTWLVALAELLALSGLPALARRTARLATGGAPSTAELASLRDRLDHPLGLRPATDGVGSLDLGRASGDVTDRWRRWLVLAGEGGGRGASSLSLEAVGQQLVGMEVGQALLTLASLRPEVAATAATPAGVA